MSAGLSYDSAVMTALSASRIRTPITLDDVARLADVSPITVSRALHGGSVAVATRERVLAAAAQLGYLPNLLARGLVQNRTSTVGMVIVELANPFFAPMVSAVETVAAKRGSLVVIGESARSEQRERRAGGARCSAISASPRIAGDRIHTTLAYSDASPLEGRLRPRRIREFA